MPIFNWSDDTPIETAIGEAIGAGSMCWNPPPEGIFDSEAATEIIKELIGFIHNKQIGL